MKKPIPAWKREWPPGERERREMTETETERDSQRETERYLKDERPQRGLSREGHKENLAAGILLNNQHWGHVRSSAQPSPADS
jgi:hypothetical protein